MISGVDTRTLSRARNGYGLLFGLILGGWALIALSVFDMLLRGGAGNAGPGMGVFSGVSPVGLSDRFGLPYMFSLCVTGTGAWGLSDFAKSYAMWGAMIMAMMVPTLLPHSIAEPRHARFTLGYLSVWLIGSGFAVALQWALTNSGVLDPYMVSQSAMLSAAILITVGGFQLSRFKRKQIAACQHEARNASGWQAGINCMRCCGPLMGVMFVAGLMNVVAMALMTGFILLERYAPVSDVVVKLSGIGLIVLGLAVLV